MTNTEIQNRINELYKEWWTFRDANHPLIMDHYRAYRNAHDKASNEGSKSKYRKYAYSSGEDLLEPLKSFWNESDRLLTEYQAKWYEVLVKPCQHLFNEMESLKKQLPEWNMDIIMKLDRDPIGYLK